MRTSAGAYSFYFQLYQKRGTSSAPGPEDQPQHSDEESETEEAARSSSSLTAHPDTEATSAEGSEASHPQQRSLRTRMADILRLMLGEPTRVLSYLEQATKAIGVPAGARSTKANERRTEALALAGQPAFYRARAGSLSRSMSYTGGLAAASHEDTTATAASSTGVETHASEASKWLLVTQYCTVHGIQLSSGHLCELAEQNDWASFLYEAEVQRFPPQQILGIVNNYFTDAGTLPMTTRCCKFHSQCCFSAA